MNRDEKNHYVNMKKIAIIVIFTYCVLTVSFYFLSGDQLFFRNSRGNFEMPSENAGTIELVKDSVIEQKFCLNIQRLESIDIQWGTYYRMNAGIISITLLREDLEETILQAQIDAVELSEGQIITINADKPIEGVYGIPLVLQLTSNSTSGTAATPLMNNNSFSRDGFVLEINGKTTEGVLCFAIRGTDYIWIGQHYWQFVIICGLLIMFLIAIVSFRYSKGKTSHLINIVVAIKKYKFLIQQLVNRDFKAKYKRSVLGIFWSFLNPLLMMFVQYYVFSTIFQSSINNFATYLIIGTVMFNFFSESCGMTMLSILGNSNLITKINMPKYIYPLTRTISSVVNLSISIIPMFIVCIVTGVIFKKATILALFFFICLIIFCLGIGMILSTSMVFFRDTQFLWNVVSMIWMYATPIFYPETILPDNLRIVLFINPLYHFLKNTRICIMDGMSPEPIAYIQCIAIAIITLLIGTWLFNHKQDKFVLYL